MSRVLFGIGDAIGDSGDNGDEDLGDTDDDWDDDGNLKPNKALAASAWLMLATSSHTKITLLLLVLFHYFVPSGWSGGSGITIVSFSL